MGLLLLSRYVHAHRPTRLPDQEDEEEEDDDDATMEEESEEESADPVDKMAKDALIAQVLSLEISFQRTPFTNHFAQVNPHSNPLFLAGTI